MISSPTMGTVQEMGTRDSSLSCPGVAIGLLLVEGIHSTPLAGSLRSV